MPFASFPDNFAMYDVTPVENLFLLEYLPHAPGDFVRVYLYGLMRCRHPAKDDGLEEMAGALGMTREQVLSAFRYWERQGLVTGLSDNPPTFQYLDVRSTLLAAAREESDAYAYGDFNRRLQAMFAEPLESRHYAQAMEWAEDLGLTADVVLILVKSQTELLTLKNGGKPRSLAYAFKALSQEAMRWAEKGVRTVEAAEIEAQKSLPPYRAARLVLDELNLRRNPTAAEIALSRKWLETWNLTDTDIRWALTQTTKSANPSFAYLDGILARRHAGAATPAREDSREAVKKVLFELGAGSRLPTDEITAAYESFLVRGFAPETVLRAAQGLNKKNRHAFRDLEEVLEKWLSLGLTTPEAASAYVQKRGELRALTLSVFEKAGISKNPAEADLDQTEKWLLQASPEMILLAAEQSAGLKLPQRSMQKRLSEWAAAGIATPEAAKTFKRPGAGGSGSAPAANPALGYAQRSYSPDFFDDFFVDLGKKDGDAP